MKEFNLNKLVIAVLLGVCLTLAIGSNARRGFGAHLALGTYQIASSANPYQSGAFVLNTQTGRVWMYIQGKWSDLGHVSGMEEVTPKRKAVYRESGISFERQ
jgi:hypothetical protein